MVDVEQNTGENRGAEAGEVGQAALEGFLVTSWGVWFYLKGNHHLLPKDPCGQTSM